MSQFFLAEKQCPYFLSFYTGHFSPGFKSLSNITEMATQLSQPSNLCKKINSPGRDSLDFQIFVTAFQLHTN